MALVEGTVDVASIVVGDWSEIQAEYPIGSDNWLLIGNAPEGVLEIEKEIYEHESTKFPRVIDLRVPVRTGMKFTAVIEEIHAENVRLILGQAPNDSGSYVYVGALVTTTLIQFRAKRVRISDGVEITVNFWKANAAGLFSLAGGDEAVGSPIEIVALDDSAGDYGGSTNAPLGYVHVPAKTV